MKNGVVSVGNAGHYLSNLLHVETGESILGHIYLYVINLAKTQLLSSNTQFNYQCRI